MKSELREAAQAVLDRWNAPIWRLMHHRPTADLMADLASALKALDDDEGKDEQSV